MRLFTKEDSQHTGFVSYSVFVHILSSGLSLSELSGAHMNDLLGLFDVTGTDVAYGPFVHYVSQQPASQTLTRLKTRLLLHRTALQVNNLLTFSLDITCIFFVSQLNFTY